MTKVYEVLATARGLAELWTQELTFAAQLEEINEFNFGDEAPTKMKITELVKDEKMSWHCIDLDPEWVELMSALISEKWVKAL